jgi:O-acetyl-ADP-ribose deacetylase (regulator of RNase III)
MDDSSHKLRQKVIFDSNITIEIMQGDITLIETGAMVNAANRHLQHGGGVAGAISRRGGTVIQEESDAWIARYGPIDSDRPAYTSAGNLPCQYVIHAVGPVWGEGEEDRKLSEAICAALKMAETLRISSVSLPAISTGIFGFPVKRAAGIFMRSLQDFCAQSEHKHLRNIKLVLFDMETYSTFSEAFLTTDWKTKSNDHIL